MPSKARPTAVPEENAITEVPEIPENEKAALRVEQAELDKAILQAQVQHLTGRLTELARENARLKAK